MSFLFPDRARDSSICFYIWKSASHLIENLCKLFEKEFPLRKYQIRGSMTLSLCICLNCRYEDTYPANNIFGKSTQMMLLVIAVKCPIASTKTTLSFCQVEVLFNPPQHSSLCSIAMWQSEQLLNSLQLWWRAMLWLYSLWADAVEDASLRDLCGLQSMPRRPARTQLLTLEGLTSSWRRLIISLVSPLTFSIGNIGKHGSCHVSLSQQLMPRRRVCCIYQNCFQLSQIDLLQVTMFGRDPPAQKVVSKQAR